jgi:hypothetical protein
MVAGRDTAPSMNWNSASKIRAGHCHEDAMSQEHINDPRKARRALIELRRNWARVVVQGCDQRGSIEEAIKGITDVQHAIEAINQAVLRRVTSSTRAQ